MKPKAYCRIFMTIQNSGGFGKLHVPMTGFWLIAWSGALSCSWLLPNHYMPWTAFHTDAWCALIFLFGAAAIFLRTKGPIAWSRSATVIGVATFIPIVQYSTGMISFAGQSWIVSLYLLGLLLALLAGQRWEQAQPGQLADGMFLAIGIASIASVSLQLNTWIGVIDTGIFDIWSMGLSGTRPYANLGQPNQLATLLMWGLMASAWAFHTERIGAKTSAFLASFLLVGIALTQSRTAWLALTSLTLATWWWRRLWRSPNLPWVATALYLFFWVCNPILHALRNILKLGVDGEAFRLSSQGELRFAAWRLLSGAALEKPWFGYGWTTIAKAQLAVAPEFPPLYPTFGYSHNLFLDLMLWLGIPIGALASALLIIWFASTAKRVVNGNTAILVMCLGTIGIHAMLEFPLYYAYFLLPVGAMAGILNAHVGEPRHSVPRWTVFPTLTIVAALFSTVIMDYFNVESSYQQARYESARIGSLPEGAPPKTILLTQLRENINFMRASIKEGMTAPELASLIAVATTYPSGGRSYKVAKALALNNQPIQATNWLATICKISSPDECTAVRNVWMRDSAQSALIASVQWPQ